MLHWHCIEHVQVSIRGFDVSNRDGRDTIDRKFSFVSVAHVDFIFAVDSWELFAGVDFDFI